MERMRGVHLWPWSHLGGRDQSSGGCPSHTVWQRQRSCQRLPEDHSLLAASEGVGRVFQHRQICWRASTQLAHCGTNSRQRTRAPPVHGAAQLPHRCSQAFVFLVQPDGRLVLDAAAGGPAHCAECRPGGGGYCRPDPRLRHAPVGLACDLDISPRRCASWRVVTAARGGGRTAFATPAGSPRAAAKSCWCPLESRQGDR